VHRLLGNHLLRPSRQPFFFEVALDVLDTMVELGETYLGKPANYYSPRTLIRELWEALSFVRFRYVDVPLGIGRNILRAIELTGPVSAASELLIALFMG
jgi:hypothetical protein